MGNKGLNYAFIDCQNLHKAILKQGWYLSYKKFRKYLADKYGIEKALIVTGDGDFYCLVEHLIKNGKLLKVMAPDSGAYSCFFRRFGLHLVYMNTLRNKLEHKKKRGINLRTEP